MQQLVLQSFVYQLVQAFAENVRLPELFWVIRKALQQAVCKVLALFLGAHDGAELGVDVDVIGGYASDLLSNVMGQAAPGMIWVTMQGHQNIAAVASLIGLSAVIVAGDAPIEEDTLKKAEQNDVLILATSLPAYDVIGKLYELGIRNVK